MKYCCLQAGREMEMQRGVWNHVSHPNELVVELGLKHTISFVFQGYCAVCPSTSWDACDFFEVIFEKFVAGINESWDSNSKDAASGPVQLE